EAAGGQLGDSELGSKGTPHWSVSFEICVVPLNFGHEHQHSLLDSALAPSFAVAIAGAVSIPSRTRNGERHPWLLNSSGSDIRRNPPRLIARGIHSTALAIMYAAILQSRHSY